MVPAPTKVRRQAATNTRINLGPLTTTFAAPSYCSRNALACPTCIGATRGQSCKVNGNTASAEDDTGCWPRATAYPKNGQAPLMGMGFYSPGIICPTGYVSACTAISTTQGQKGATPQVTGHFQFPLVAGETAVGCCPTGYSCMLNGGVQTCHQAATSTAFDALTCNGVTEGDLDAFKVPFTSGSQTITSMDLWAPMIQINHMATDLPEEAVKVEDESTMMSSAPSSLMTITGLPGATPTATSAAATSTLATTSAVPTSALTAAPTVPAAAQQTAEPDHRLPTGTKVGIAMAPIAGAALLLGFLFYRKWKKRYLYPEKDFLPPKPSNPPSPDPSERDAYNHDREAFPSAAVHQSPNMSTSAFPAFDPTNTGAYSTQHTSRDFATGGPGPVVVTPYGPMGHEEHVAEIDDINADPWSHEMGMHPADTHAARLGRSLDEGVGGMDSPIDGTSPFRLKRGDTLKKKDKTPLTESEVPVGGAEAKRVSQLRRSTSVSSHNSRSSTPSNHSSQNDIEWEYPASIKREDSFSRPRPRPKTGTSSLYVDDRASSVYSWNNAAEPLPTEPLPTEPLPRNKSFSRPMLRPKRDHSEDTLVEGEYNFPGVPVPPVKAEDKQPVPRVPIPPPVTAEGVAF